MLTISILFSPFLIMGVSCVIGFRSSSVVAWYFRKRLSPEEIESINKPAFCRFLGCAILVVGAAGFAYTTAMHLQGVNMRFTVIYSVGILLFSFAYSFYLKRFVIKGKHFRKKIS